MAPVVVAGALANKAGSGGEAWVRLSWVLGLEDLGLEVRFVEQLAEASCTDAAGAPADPSDSVQAAWFRTVVQEFGLGGRATLLIGDDAVVGPPLDDVAAVAGSAVLVNISGHLHHPGLMPLFRSRVYVDIDPGFTQIWHAHGLLGTTLETHDRHMTIGENIGTAVCSIPTSGFRWRPVRQPVRLADWPITAPPSDASRFTTVSSWRPPFGPLEYEGRTYGLKLHEFRRLVDLPKRAPATFEIALDIHPGDAADRRLLLDHGWRLTDPRAVAGTPGAFRSYVQGSAAEFSVAQGVYVDTCSGWFSDRTVRYLASGRPALVQDTGFGRSLPVGTGLVAFTTMAEAEAGVAAIIGDYEGHATAAREIAERHFAAEKVLDRFCDEAGVG